LSVVCFKQPTKVDIHYHIEDNNFSLTTIPAVEDDEMYVSDIDDYTLHEYDNNRVFG
jgi:hypothetical protein